MDDNKKIKRTKFYIVPQTEEKIERNRKIIEEMRSRGLLEKYEKHFNFSQTVRLLRLKKIKKNSKNFNTNTPPLFLQFCQINIFSS